MGIANFEHWGVVVRPGETVRCDPGEVYCHISQIALQAGKGNEHVRVFVKADSKELLIGTLSVDKYPQCTTDLVFEKEFELLHTSKTSSISAIGYKFSEDSRKSDTSAEEDDESDDDVPLAIPLHPSADDDKSKETKSGADKLAAPRAAVAQSSEPKVTLEETKNPGKIKANVDGIDDDGSDEDSDYSEENESSDEDSPSRDEDDSENPDEDDDEDSPRNTKGKNRPAETSLKTPLEKKSKIAKPSTANKSSEDENPRGKNRPAETPMKTPQEKKAKIATPSVGNKTGSGTARQSDHIHVATPFPSKQAKKKTFYR